ncbi:TPA: hypothetical protein QEK37_002194 [Stenotrophomonas maltophilia]|nr:hypothetical protein [Stenotrophomonas maltophilia]HDS1327852.1 hypothetical protein [Stenotrophomonas maltophilia]HDS1332949.1 hypothetical protein [Stenotrophomonas maltophilia]HDS1337598.1 hypothetical protein [Stenotrophomonas maltophilia]HDS1341449.1 hypothetical protein [Stenotrophomonas maltophilia]
MNHAPAPTVSVMTPQARFTLCFCIAVFLVGPFGLLLGPVISRLLRRRAERKTPTAAYAAEQRSNGHFNLAQLLVVTLFGVWGIVGLVALVPMAMFLASVLFA